MTTERDTTRHGPASRTAPGRPLAAGLAILGATALVKGVWGVLAPEQLARAGEAVLGEPWLRLGATTLVWAALLALAGYMTVRGDALRRRPAAAGWIMAIWLWLGGMLLLYVPVEPYRELVQRILGNPGAPRAIGLIGIAVGTALLGLALALWAEEAVETRPAGRPMQHPRPV